MEEVTLDPHLHVVEGAVVEVTAGAPEGATGIFRILLFGKIGCFGCLMQSAVCVALLFYF